ncbi:MULTISPECIES: glycosyltransferase [unclassified Methylobacterium]|jgi:predicted glycosyltransferase|uniref:glycosyltransferase n=1 Tax=unclassified Methylobacterium TaxID=2615210 RepID=UPI001FEE125D|nr:glycosyltransferase [Methylobacterium sp. 2A]
MRVLIAVTHLLGAGHLTRAAALGRAFATAGHEVMLISGGVPAPLVRLDSVRLVQLPPLHIVGTAFSTLLKPDGEPADTEWLTHRRTVMREAFEGFAPDAVLTELFPFGRRALAEEFLALVEAANARVPRPLILASVRDILVASPRPERIAQAHARVAAFYDAVLVHGDPTLVPLDASWPLDSVTAAKLRYTGYVDEGTRPVPAAARAGVLVAAGSGPAGLLLLRAAADAARLRPDLGWRILAGHGVPEGALTDIARGLPEHILGRARADYRALLAGAALSVSQSGYNTATDLLAAGTPAVLVPFEAGGETEQRLRAEHLAARGLARILPEATLHAGALLQAVEAQLRAPPPGVHGLDLRGAARSVEIVEALHADRRGRSRQPTAGTISAPGRIDPARARSSEPVGDASSGREGTAQEGRTRPDESGATCPLFHAEVRTRTSGPDAPIEDEVRVAVPVPEGDRVRDENAPDATRPRGASVAQPILNPLAPHPDPVPQGRGGRSRSATNVAVQRKDPGLPARTGEEPTLRPDGVSCWHRLRQALDAAGERGLVIPFLWRDDDAVTATPALDRLVGLAQDYDAPLLLAAIPAGLEPALARRLEAAPDVSVAVHGLAHRNHAPPGAKPAEFGADRPLAACVADAAAGLRIARERVPGSILLPVFVPPWNRLAPTLAAALPDLGYRGLSAVPGPPIAGLRRIDATLDPIDWRGSRSLRDPGAMLDALADAITQGPERPIGLLTHHLAQDEAVWGFIEALLSVLLKHPAIAMLHPRSAFDSVAMDRCDRPPHHAGLEVAGTV